MKPALPVTVMEYTPIERAGLVRLLFALQSDYLRESIAANIRELQEEKDPREAHESYVDFLEHDGRDTWRVFLARTGSGELAGFIIGSIETDERLVLGPIGKVEDWYVEKELRGKGIGTMLYVQLEKWLGENGCKQVRPDTWNGNETSVEVHRRMGFFISGVQFGKKL